MSASRWIGIWLCLGLTCGVAAQDDDTRLLHLAAAAGDVPQVTALLAKGVRVDAVSQGSTALQLAAGQFGNTPLAVAAQHGRIEVMKLLMSRGSKADARAVDMGPDAETPLFRAARHGQVEAMKLLIDRGADVNAKNSDNRTPLFGLATLTTLKAHEKEAMLLLIAHKADVNVKDGHAGKTPLAYAIENRNAEAIEVLKANGAQ